MLIDLRSDTFTKPDEKMLYAMFRADVGDDVFDEDLTVKKLEQKTANYFGMDAGLFCPSGTMTNQIAIACHTSKGEEVICDTTSHVYLYEAGGIAFHSACQVKLLQGDRGRLQAQQIREAIAPNDLHKAKSTLVSIENTANRGGGACYLLDELESIQSVCKEHKLALHIDGARLWNALIAKKQTPTDYGKIVDSISVCFSKGLGAPVGSVLLGSHAFIAHAKRTRKLFGGGMRQAGYLAAACLYALENNIERLEIDHYHAKQLEASLHQKEFIDTCLPVETNIVIANFKPNYSPVTFVEALDKVGIKCIAISSNQVRMVTHLDVDAKGIEKTLKCIASL